jgi:TonB-dependent receptor
VSLVALVACTFPAAAQEAPAPDEQQDAEIVVTGIRGSLSSAQARKEQATAVVDSIVAEDIGKLPDNTVADALQRVTGVQVSRNNGEASTVLIRGLPNVRSYLNGRESFTGTGRGVALQDIPAELVAGVDVYKTATPEMVEGGVAGRIDIRLRRPFDLEPGLTVAGSARALYSDKREKWSYIVSGLTSGRWESEGGQEFGILLGASYNKRLYRDQTAFNFGFNDFNNAATNNQDVLIPDTVGALITDGNRNRPAVNASLQWRPTPDLEFYADALFTGYRNDYDVNFFVGLPKAGNVTAVELQDGTVEVPRADGTVPRPVAGAITTRNNFTITSKQAFEQKTDGYQVASGAKFSTGQAVLSTEVSYNDSTVASTSYIVDANFVVPRIDYDFDVDGTPHITALNADGSSYDLSDPANLNLFALFDQNNLATSKQLAWRGDLLYAFDAGALQNIELGFRTARRTGNQNGTGENRFGLSGAGTDYPGFGVQGPTDILGGIVGVDGFALPSTEFIRANIDELRAIAGRPAGTPDFRPALAFDLVEKNYAGYAQAQFDFTGSGLPLEMLVGARLVQNDTRLDATLVTTVVTDTGNTTVLTPTTRERNDFDVLPNLTLKFRPVDDFVIRLVGGKSVTMPEFAQLNPATNLEILGATGGSFTAGAGSGGNPDLRLIKSTNLDATAEWYFSRTGSLTLSAFYRDLKDYIQNYAEVERFPTGEGGELQDYLVTRPRNTGDGSLKGVELAYQHFFDFLPGPLSGFGVQANFTLADGEVEAPPRPGQAPDFKEAITLLSKYSYNLVAMYEKYGLSARLAYNWRSKYTDSYALGLPGGFVEVSPIAFLDFSASYDLTSNITLSVDATNLLNETYRDSFGGYAITPRDTRQYDRTFSTGVRFRF